jgi:carbamate kinase
MRIVVALGGNALAPRGEPISADVQRMSVQRATRALAPLASDHQLVITHGNGPQVGMLLLESEANRSVPAYPLDILGAESEGMIGYLLEEGLRQGIPGIQVATLLTCSIVDAADPAFAAPSKPIGPLYAPETARRLADERGFTIAPDTGGYRRVVPSPEPIGIVEERAVHALVDAGVTVIASGGGGVPVIVDASGRPRGVEGVVDKDLAAVVLARTVNADALLLLTDVAGVYRNFGAPAATLIRRMSTEEVADLLKDGVASPGSMAPKLEAARRFAETGGYSVIASLDAAERALRRDAGTRIYKAGHYLGAHASIAFPT